MHEFINKYLNPEVQGTLDKSRTRGESGEGEGGAAGDDRPGAQEPKATLDLHFDRVADFRDLRHREQTGETFITYDVPELGCCELHLELRGPGIWYASLVDCEDGTLLAKGRLFPR